ncbi:unnamed protein product [Trichobilharzia regenti]|nr:unnamed protein product [Trichobilharzia regenti]
MHIEHNAEEQKHPDGLNATLLRYRSVTLPLRKSCKSYRINGNKNLCV